MTPTPNTQPQAKTPQEALLDACIHCGFCLPVCPTYQVTGSEAESPRGRIYLMRSVLAPNADNTLLINDIAPHLDHCLGCMACQTACPSGVNYNELLHQSRTALKQQQPPTSQLRTFKRWALRQLLPKPHRLLWLTRLTKLYQTIGLHWFTRRYLSKLPILKALKAPIELLPNIQHWQGHWPSLRPGQQFGNPTHPKVALFTGCIMNAWFQRIHWASIRVLVAQDYCVCIPEQTCCGALADHTGEADIAEPLAQHNITQLLANDYQYIVVNAAGCGSTLKHYPAHHTMTHEQTAQWSNRVVDILELLQRTPLNTDDMRSPFSETQQVAYQAACHLRHAQGITDIESTLLNQLPNVQCIPLADSQSCCGSAGVYNMEYPEMAKAILKQKMESLSNSTRKPLQWMVSANPGCLMQYEYGLREFPINPNPVLAHPVELIARYYPDITL